MKMNRLFKNCLALGVLAFSAMSLAAAEPGTEPPRRNGPPGDGPRGQRFMQVQQRGGVPMEMVFNEEQRATFREEMDGQRDKLRALDEKNVKLRRELDEALFAEKLDEKLVREKSAALSEIEVERSLIRARAFAKVRPSLTEEQLERLKTMRGEFAQGPRPGEGGARPGQFRQQPRPPGGQPPDDVLPPPAPPRPPGDPAR